MLNCPRCQRANPDESAYCWFDGGSLLSAQNGVQKLPRDFLFPSGRRCPSLEDFAQACQDEWSAARDLLTRDAFRQYFIAMGRLDLVRLVQDAMQEPNPDVALSRFVDGLPVPRDRAARLDFQPRRLTLGRIPVGDTREVELVVTNQGHGTLQGTVSIVDGGDWLSFPDSPEKHEIRVETAKEQRVRLIVDARSLEAARNYVGRLMVVTSGGVAEAPIRFELVAKPFPRMPFQGVRTPRELAERMRKTPKPAGPLLEGGDVERWFASNNWNYPVQGPVARGIAGVQQFFEAMGLSRPPQLQLSQKEIRLSAESNDPVRCQVALQTQARKWVYGLAVSQSPWVRVLTTKVIGPQNASIVLEADPKLRPRSADEGRVQIIGNGGQKLELSVWLDVKRPAGSSLVRAALIAALACLAFRLAMIPIADLAVLPAAVHDAASSLGLAYDAWLSKVSWSLRLPPDRFSSAVAAEEFRHRLLVGLMRRLIAWLWWLGPAAMVLLVARRKAGFAFRDLPMAVIAGTVGGVVAAATLACAFLTVESAAHGLWTWLGGESFLGWCLLAATVWTSLGAMAGLAWARLTAQGE